MSSPRRRNLKDRLASAIGHIAGSVGDVVASAHELLTDTELRRKGAAYVVQEATKSIHEAQRGFEAGAGTLQQTARARLGAGAQKLQSVLRNIERQVSEFQKQQQQRDLQAELEYHHKLPVDIQIGGQCFEDMPQEMRSRLWYILLERPDLAQGLMRRNSSASSHRATAQAAASIPQQGSPQQPAAASLADSNDQSLPSRGVHQRLPAPAAQSAAEHQHPAVGFGNSSGSAGTPRSDCPSPFAAVCSSPEAAFVAESGPLAQPADSSAADTTSDVQADMCAQSAGQSAPQQPAAVFAEQAGIDGRGTEDNTPDIEDFLSEQSTGVLVSREVSMAIGQGVPAAVATASNNNSSSSDPDSTAAAGSARQASGASSQPSAASPWLLAGADIAVAAVAAAANAAGIAASSSGQSVSPIKPSAPSPWDQNAAANNSMGNSLSEVPGASTPVPADPQSTAVQGGLAAGMQAAAATPVAGLGGKNSNDGESWEFVPRQVIASSAVPAGGELEALDSLRGLVQSLEDEDSLDAAREAQHAIFKAMLNVAWLPGEGIPPQYDEAGEYAQLLAAGCGALEEIIHRDVPRTFPEHPLFSSQDGQGRLFRLLKAYAAADPEVGYCQGMAFAAGVLLMYLPEEPAFRLFQRLMQGGPGLRRLYLPGLQPLKLELSRFELLLGTHHPQLHQHLLDAGLPALLYAAQWFMTSYSCPFPLHLTARVMDILLQSDSDAIMPRLGLAVVGAMQDQLLDLDDFEALITHIKVTPLAWPMHQHREVFQAALNSPATNAELAAAAQAAAAEYQKMGRLSSFSHQRLLRQHTSGGTQQLELSPGPLGPRTEAAAAAAGELPSTTAAAVPTTMADEASSSLRGMPLLQQQQQQEVAELKQLDDATAALQPEKKQVLAQQQVGTNQQQVSSSNAEHAMTNTPAAAKATAAPGHADSGSGGGGVLGDLDVAFIDLLQDLNVFDTFQ